MSCLRDVLSTELLTCQKKRGARATLRELEPVARASQEDVRSRNLAFIFLKYLQSHNHKSNSIESNSITGLNPVRPSPLLEGAFWDFK